VRLRAVHRTALAAAHELTVDMTTQGSRLLLLFGCGRRFCLVDVETKEATERELPNEAVVTSVAFAASALMLFVGLSSSKVGIFDARSVAPLTFVSVPSLHRIAAHPRVPELFFVTTKGGGVHLVGPGLGHNTWYAAAGADDQMTDSSLLAAQRSAAALDGDSADADALLKRKKSASAVNAPRAPRKQTTASEDEGGSRAAGRRRGTSRQSGRVTARQKKRAKVSRDDDDDDDSDDDSDGKEDDSDDAHAARKRARRLAKVSQVLPARTAKLVAYRSLCESDGDSDAPTFNYGGDDESTVDEFDVSHTTSDDDTPSDSSD